MQLGVDETYEVLHVLEFTSTRKRMSVVVRMPDGKIKLMSKGAVSYDIWLRLLDLYTLNYILSKLPLFILFIS